MSTPVAAEALRRLDPIASLSAASVRELSRLCYIEHVDRNHDPFRLHGPRQQAVYLIKGELRLVYADDSSEILVGGTEAAAAALGKREPAFTGAKAITDIDLVRIDEDMLDIMLTWDQLAGPRSAKPATPAAAAAGPVDVDATDWRTMSGLFAAENLTRGTFSGLPAAHIDALFGRFRRVRVRRDQVIIREGDDGDSYYVIESGRCTVTRRVGGANVELADLKTGDAFGEEALVSSARRNASVTMKTDGVLLQLAKEDFIELLREPLIRRISRAEAERKAADGAVWLDVRFAAEYTLDKLPGAIKIPHTAIRNLFGSLDRGKEYIVYCQTGRRSSAAAFLLSQHGYKTWLLDGGLRNGTA